MSVGSRNLFSLLFICLGCISASVVNAESPWASFHGAEGMGVADGQIPDKLSESFYDWKVPLGSRDVGSPVIANGIVFCLVSKPDSKEIALQAFDLKNGKLLWSKSFPQTEYHLHSRNTIASSTPACDGKHVYAAWAEPEHTFLKCFDLKGNEVWSRDFGSWQSQHGFGTSPRLFGSMVILMNSQQADQLKPGQVAGESRMIAVDRETGKDVWETELATTRSCYGVPAIYQPENGEPQIVGANKGNGLFGVDPVTGRIKWSLSVFSMRCCSTPLIVDNIAIGSSGSGGGGNHLVAVRIPEDDDAQPQEVYRIERGAPYVPTPAYKDDMLFLVSDKGGIASCIDAKTGEKIWSARLGGNFGASPIVIGNKVLLISLDGMATVLSATADYKKLGETDLGGPVGATPAFADGRLLIRVDEELRCLKTD